MNFLDADYSAIEARIVNWLAGQEDALAEYRQGVDRYKRMASVIYGVPESEVTKFPMRFIGKQTVLGCIAEGQLVLTDCGLVPIEEVSCCHRVWDGVEWVNHEGVIYQGQKQVISYQGLVATPDHPVYCVGFSGTTDLRTASKQLLGLAVSGEGRTPIRTMDTFDESRVPLSRRLSPHESAVRVRDSGLSQRVHTLQQTECRLRSMCPQGSDHLLRSQVACVPSGGRTFPMQEPTQSELPQLRWTGNRVPIRVGSKGSKLGDGQFGIEERIGNRPEEQQWALRAKEFEIHHSPGASAELSDKENRLYLPGRRMALHNPSGLEISEAWVEPETDFGEGVGRSFRETQTLASDQKTVACFDILNAGPRHRYTVSNALVHNCSYQMGPAKFRKTCEKFGYKDLPAGLEDKAVKAFRQKHKKIVQYWYDLEKAAKSAILRKGTIFPVRNVSFLCRDVEGMMFLLLKLPSGRKLAYPKPRIIPSRKFPDATTIVFFGHILGTQWGDVETYAGKICENLVQGIAADIMANGAHNAEREGFAIATLIHDQCLTYKREGQTAEKLVELLTELPPWAAGLPLAAEGSEVPFYKKD